MECKLFHKFHDKFFRRVAIVSNRVFSCFMWIRKEQREWIDSIDSRIGRWLRPDHSHHRDHRFRHHAQVNRPRCFSFPKPAQSKDSLNTHFLCQKRALLQQINELFVTTSFCQVEEHHPTTQPTKKNLHVLWAGKRKRRNTRSSSMRAPAASRLPLSSPLRLPPWVQCTTWPMIASGLTVPLHLTTWRTPLILTSTRSDRYSQ